MCHSGPENLKKYRRLKNFLARYVRVHHHNFDILKTTKTSVVCLHFFTFTTESDAKIPQLWAAGPARLSSGQLNVRARAAAAGLYHC